MITCPIIAVAVFLMSLWRPKFGAAAVIVLWPAYLLRTTIHGIPTTALELSLYGFFGATIILLLTKKIPWHWVQISKITWVMLLVWIVAWLIATFHSTDITASLGAVKAWLFDPLLFSALLIVVIHSDNDRRFITAAAIISAVVVAVFGLYQMVGLRSTLQEGRLSSFFHPVANYAAMYLAPIAVLSLGLLLLGFLKRIWWVAFGLILIALGLSLSYGGFLALGAGMVLIWFFLPAGRLKKWLAIIGLSGVVVFVLLLSTTKNFSEHFGAGRSSGLVRTQIWVTSWALIRQHPITGIGPNVFESAYRAEIPKHYFPPLEWLVSQPHNLYLALWLETGLLGLIAFLAPFIRHVVLLKRDYLPKVTERAMAVASLAALVAILVHGLVDTPFLKNDLAMQYMFLAVLPWLGNQQK